MSNIRDIKVDNPQDFQKQVGIQFGKFSFGKPITIKLMTFPKDNKLFRDQITGEICGPRIKKLLDNNTWFGCYYKEPKSVMEAYTTLFDDIAFRIVKAWFSDEALYGGIEIFDTEFGRPLNKFLPYAVFIPVTIIKGNAHKLLRFDYMLNIPQEESADETENT